MPVPDYLTQFFDERTMHDESQHSTTHDVPSRRDFLSAVGIGALAAATATSVTRSALANTLTPLHPLPQEKTTMVFTLPELPYAENALEPTIDALTMNIHRTKHHNAYVTNLNKALDGHPTLQAMSIDEICRNINTMPDGIKTAVRNNGGGHWNHSMYWTWMAPKGSGGAPSPALSAALAKAFGSVEEFKVKFAAAGVGRFGSGWAWLCKNADGTVAICSTANQDNPLMKGIVDGCGTPILGCDVWEHAYYLHYQNRRPDYLAAWWDVVNWNAVNALYA